MIDWQCRVTLNFDKIKFDIFILIWVVEQNNSLEKRHDIRFYILQKLIYNFIFSFLFHFYFIFIHFYEIVKK